MHIGFMYCIKCFGPVGLSSLLIFQCSTHAFSPSPLQMFPWSALFSTEPQLPGQRSPEEMVTDTLMLELGALLKRTERLRQERATEGRRRSSSVDYSWLAANPPKHAYELTPGEVLELQGLCAKIPPSQCGPVILRFRKLVTEFEPDVNEVPRIFRSVLSDCLEDDALGLEEERMREQASRFHKPRSKSLSLVTFRSKFRINPFRGGGLPEQEGEPWPVEEEEEEGLPMGVQGRTRRVRSMPDITPMEESAQS
ncbi:RD3 domain-containing protein isoform X1 [Anguilla anguilla]|uniref:RD3 domain-containing protein isoform X1 n=2 Tax=Anguilla TaxID=7935 RepID=UPI0015A99C0B|nr:RD3 domain-containing protein isoform X1 [Anguilla anguilla]